MAGNLRVFTRCDHEHANLRGRCADLAFAAERNITVGIQFHPCERQRGAGRTTHFRRVLTDATGEHEPAATRRHGTAREPEAANTEAVAPIRRQRVRGRHLHDVTRNEDAIDALRHTVANHERGVPDLGVQGGDRLLERYSFTKPRPTDKLTIAPMITASVGFPVKPETVAAARRSNSNGLRSWRANTVQVRTA